MLNMEILVLIALGITSIFGLQGALKLSINHFNIDKYKQGTTSCNKILNSKEAYLVKIPIAYLASIFYIILILQIIRLSNDEEINFYWINFEISFAVLATLYFAFVMFLKLRIICFSCLRIYLANLIMAVTTIIYHLN